MSKIQAKNAVVFGVSADTVASHKQFAAKEHLNFALLADPDKKVIAAYGVLNPAGYANRVTFIIGPDGKIQQIDRAVNAEFTRGKTLTTRHGEEIALHLSNWRAQIGRPVPNFSLPDDNGMPIPLLPPGKKATAVIFIEPDLPASRAYAERLRSLASSPLYKDVAFLGIASGAGATAGAIKADREQEQLPFPVTLDLHSAIARHFNARVAPTAWVINAKGIAVYHGAIDDSANPGLVKASYLKDALEAILADKPTATPVTKATGDRIRLAPRK